MAAVAALAAVTPIQLASADGVPDVTLTASGPGVALLGGTYQVALTASNGTATPGYNASFNLLLPAGASLVTATPAPTSSTVRLDGSTAVVWSNVSDLLSGASSAVTAEVDAGSLPLGVHTLAAGAFVHDQPRFVPDFDADGAEVAGSFTGHDLQTLAVELVPFLITADVQRPENEVVRGVHDQKTVVNVLVENNHVGASTDLVVRQYLPAAVEFLGCGGVDNTAPGIEEYPGAGRIDDTPAPAIGACPAPASVETVVTDPPGPQPAALYTVVTWDTATLAGLGWDALTASGTFAFDYVIGIPQHANVEFPPGTPTTGEQTANLDNNTGATTAETASETGVTVISELVGTYAGSQYTSQAAETVTLEDLAIQKTVDTSAIVQGGLSGWSLALQVSEYTTAVTDVVVTDTLPDGLCPLGAGDPDCAGGPAPVPAYTSALENPDGTWTLVWNLPDLAANDTAAVTFSTRARTAYQENGADQEPVRARDSWTNQVNLTGTATDREIGTRAVADASSAGQRAASIDLAKEVASPDAGGTCVEGAVWTDALSPASYGPGDTVCWRLTISTPSGLDTTGLLLTDFLPAGYDYVSSAATSDSDVAIATTAVDVPRLDWTFTNGGNLDANSVARLIVTTQVVDPQAAEVGDILGNLAKLTYQNTAADIFQLRDDALAPWQEAELVLDKSASAGTAPGGATVTYTIEIGNEGNQDALDVEVRDLLPAAIDCSDLVSPLGHGLVCTDANPDRLDTTVASIPAATTATLDYQVVLPVNMAPSQVLTNHAGVRLFDVVTNGSSTFTYQPDENIDPTLVTPNTGPIDDTSQVTISAATIAKTRTTAIAVAGNTAAQATIGEDVSYTVTVTLPHDTTLTNARIDDTVPSRFVLDESSAAVTRNDSATPGAFTLSTTATTVRLDFPASYTVGGTNEVIVLEFTARVADIATATAGTNVGNTAYLRYSDALGTPMPNRTASISTRLLEPNLDVTKVSADGDGTATPGEVIDFTVTVANTGTNATPSWTSPAHDVTVVDSVPTSMTPLGAGGLPLPGDGVVEPDGGWWDATARTITWTTATVAPNATAAFDYQVAVADPLLSPTTFTNTALATTSSLAGPDAEERTSGGFSAARYSATGAVTLEGAQPHVTKVADVATAAPGEAVTYTVTAVIPPSVTTYDVTVLDTVPDGLTYLGTTSASCTTPVPCDITVTTLPPSGQELGWFLGDLAPAAETREVTIVYRAVVADSPSATRGAVLTNAATIGFSSADGLGVPVSPPDASSFEATAPVADVDVTVTEPTLTLTKLAADEASWVAQRRVLPSEEVDFAITLTNTGDSTAHDIVVSDAVDARMVAVDVSDGVGWVVTDGDPTDGTLGFAVDSLAAGADLTITYRLRVPALTVADEVAGPELENLADAEYTSAADGSPGAPRSYDDVVADQVGLEVDLASLGDLVWFDTVGDGVRAGDEPGVPGVTVTVNYLGPDGVLGGGDDETHLAVTAADGSWLVTELPGGTYQVSASDLPAGMAVATDLSGTPAAGGPVTLVLAEDGARRDADFGLRGTGTVGDLVWLDLDADGVTDPGEPGLAGIGVAVTWAGLDGVLGNADDLEFRTVTDALGAWEVTGVPPGDLRVELTPGTFPVGLEMASDPDGGSPDGVAAGTLGAGATDSAYDFGLRGTGSIGDLLWLDLDADGIQDGPEPGVPGADVTVRWHGLDGILGTADDAEVTVTTGAGGGYSVTALPPGDYQVEVVATPSGLAPTYDEDTGTTAPDGRTGLALADGASHLSADFGLVATTGVGDRVWLDLDGDGAQDPGEPGLPGVAITVTSAGADATLDTGDDIVLTATTGADGNWLVTGLPATVTRVGVTGDLPSGVAASHDADGVATADVSVTTLVAGVSDLVQDFGYVGTVTIGDRAWVDVDWDGTQDPEEPGLGGIAVNVTWLGPDEVLGGGDDLTVATVTAADGSYQVAGLMTGDFQVTASGAPAGYLPTWDETGPADEVILVGGLGPGATHLTADFGYGGQGSLGGLVWLDRNADGVVDDPREGGVGNRELHITWAGPDDTFATGDDVEITTRTEPGGTWSLTNLPPGQWTVVVPGATLPVGTAVVFDRQHGLAAPDGTWSGTLDPLGSHVDIDTGLRGTAAIGSLVWLDTDRDTVRDPDDAGVGGVRLTLTWLGEDGLLGGGDDIVLAESTDGLGDYLADGLPAGAYRVAFDAASLPSGTRAASDLDGGDPLLTAALLAAGETRLDVNLRLERSLATTGGYLAGAGLLALLFLATGVALARNRRSLPH